MGCVYQARSISTGKLYIGMTKHTLERRIKEHYKHAHGKSKRLGYFQRAILKHGFEDFEWSTLLLSTDPSVLYSMERFFIKELKSLTPNGYNTKEGGEGGRPTPDVIARMSEKMVQRMTENTKERERILTQCRNMSAPENREKAKRTIEVNNKDVEYRERTRKNRSEAGKRAGLTPAKKHHLDRIHSDPIYMAKLSERTHKMWEDPEFRQKMIAVRSTPMSESSKEKSAITHRELWKSPEYKEKMKVVLDHIHTDPIICEKRAEKSRKEVYSIETGCIYRSIAQASKDINCTILHVGDGGTSSGLHFEYVKGNEGELVYYDELDDEGLLTHNRIVEQYRITSRKSWGEKTRKRTSKPVICVETNCTFPSIKDAALAVGCAQNNMWQAVNKGYGAFGLHYKFVEETDATI